MNGLHYFKIDQTMNKLHKYLFSGSPYSDYFYWQTEPGRNFRLTVGYKF